jgi:hypothetical protein
MANQVNQSFALLDDIAPSFADIAMEIKGIGTPVLKTLDFKAINTGCQVDIGKLRGASGGRVRRRTTGQVEYSASITIYRQGWQALLKNLGPIMPTRGSQRIWGLVHCSIVYFWTPPGSVEIFETRIKSARFKGRDLASAESTDPDELEIALDPGEIADVIDGIEYVAL